MDELLALHRVNANRFTSLVVQIGDRWGAPTPCDEWSVRDLVNHMVAEQLWVPELLAGRTVAEIGDKFEGDVLGEDPPTTWRLAMDAALAAFAEPGVAARSVSLVRGPTPAHDYLDEMVSDLAVHGWDLARALGVDETIDPATVDRMLIEWGDRAELLAHSGLFGSPLPTSDADDPQTRLLALFGRRT
jgi:uncharacterized protein (TIGR03086 family)